MLQLCLSIVSEALEVCCSRIIWLIAKVDLSCCTFVDMLQVFQMIVANTLFKMFNLFLDDVAIVSDLDVFIWFTQLLQ